MNPLLVAAIEAAHRADAAKQQYTEIMYKYAGDIMVNGPAITEEEFWQITAAYRTLIIKAMMLRRESVPSWAADELCRISKYESALRCWGRPIDGLTALTFDRIVPYAYSYGYWKTQCGKLLDNMQQIITGKGDDGWGDLVDGLPLLGPKFFARMQKQRFYNYKHFRQVVRKTVVGFLAELINASDSDTDAARIKKYANKFCRMILDGENYFEMSLENEAASWLASFYPAEEKEQADAHGCACN